VADTPASRERDHARSWSIFGQPTGPIPSESSGREDPAKALAITSSSAFEAQEGEHHRTPYLITRVTGGQRFIANRSRKFALIAQLDESLDYVNT
jgi:hypothetical protein